MAKEQHRVTLEDVAREAGVSIMTVSRVMNNTGRISEETRTQVRAVAERLGYRPNRAARTLVTKRTMLIACIMPDITNPYFAEILQGVEDTAWQEGYNVLLMNTNENPDRECAVLAQLDDSTVDGVIACSSRIPDEQLIPLLRKHPAVVTINRVLPKDIGSVVLSQRHIGHRAVLAAKYLYQTGRRRIGYLQLVRGSSSFTSFDFVKALEAEGITIDPAWCRRCPPVWKSGYEQGKMLLEEHPELEAVVGGNDLVTLGLMRAAIELGRKIPENLALVGADDILIASQVTPPLTTFRMDKYEIGAMASRLLLLRMQGDYTYREMFFPEELVIRGTT